jgi:CheY-like chemotaxis protein
VSSVGRFSGPALGMGAARRRKRTTTGGGLSGSGERGEASERPSIVLVEDSDDLRIIFEETLRHRGWDVRSYARAAEALDAIVERQPDVVMTDINLGSLSGRGLARALRADPRTENIVIVAASGSVSPSPPLLRAFDAFLQKPVDVTTLSDRLRSLLDAR